MLESGSNSFGKSLFRCEAFGICARPCEWSLASFGAFDVGKDALFKSFAKALKRMCDALNIT
jgi:hypothetical protein